MNLGILNLTNKLTINYTLPTSSDHQMPIGIKKRILNIHKFIVKNINKWCKNKIATALPAPFEIKKPLPTLNNNFTALENNHTELVSKISDLDLNAAPVNPLTDYISSLSIKETGPYQFKSEILNVSMASTEFKTLRLKKPQDWSFHPGQYLEVRGDSSSKPTYLAVASGIDADYFEITARPNSNPAHANFCLNRLPSETLHITGPLGTFFPIDLITHDTPVLILGGGSGITALKSVMESLPDHADAKLIYSSKTLDGMIYKEEIDKWNAQGHTITLTQEKREGYAEGRITDHLPQSVLETKNALVFLCGPKELVVQTTKLLVEKGIPADRIYGSLPALAKDGGPVYRGDHPQMMSA